MRRKISVFLCVCMAASSISMPQTAYAQSLQKTSTTVTSSGVVVKDAAEGSNTKLTEKEVDTLTEITSYVKSKITISKALTEFSYDYSSGKYTSPFWTLRWSNKSGTESIRVECDNNKNILQYRYSKDNKKKYNKPVHLKSELKVKADAFIKKTVPDISGKLEYIGTSSTDIYSGSYTYEYRRVENKIPMPDNQVRVSVNYETGVVEAMSSQWLYGADIPAPKAKITKEEAAKIIGSNITMKLSYRPAFTNDSSSKAFLVYEPDKAYISIDANTGKVYTAREIWQGSGDKQDSEVGSEEKNSMAKDESQQKTLTEKEIASIKELEKLISKEEVISTIKNQKSLLLDPACTLVETNLVPYNTGNSKETKGYQWVIKFTENSPGGKENENKYQASARASVDAKTGKILSYYATTPNYYDVEQSKWDSVNVKYSLKECAPIFEAFVKEQIPQYLKDAKLAESNNDYIAAYKEDKPVYGGYTYNYERYHEEIPYSYNGFSGAVDGITGKIYRFGINWDNSVAFESPKGIMNESEAFNQYIKKDGYDLFYEVNWINDTTDNSREYKVRLVYRADIDPFTISPFTGKQLNYEGKPVTSNGNTYSYTDISSRKNKRAIMVLADLGIGFEGSKFQPTKKMTAGAFEDMLNKVDYEESNLTKKERDKLLTRMAAVKRMITFAGLEKVAKLPKIYKTGFKDEKSIASADIGYVALAKGLGIIKGDSFNQKNIVTREEAAQMIVNLLNAEY